VALSVGGKSPTAAMSSARTASTLTVLFMAARVVVMGRSMING
jgi:hypothetical protein